LNDPGGEKFSVLSDALIHGALGCQKVGIEPRPLRPIPVLSRSLQPVAEVGLHALGRGQWVAG
jgi:hypothetical protein